MADRAFIFCPFCEKNSVKQELFTGMPENHLFRCQFGHVYERDALMAMNPTMIHYQHQEKPGPHDVKAQVWVSADLWNRFRDKYPDTLNATMASIMQLSLDGDLIIVSGEQAKKLKALGVTSGAGMVTCAEERQRLAGENEEIAKENSRFWEAIRGNVSV